MFMNDNGVQGGKEMFLKIKDLKKGFGSGDSRTEVLRGIDFSVEKGEFCVLLGPSFIGAKEGLRQCDFDGRFKR